MKIPFFITVLCLIAICNGVYVGPLKTKKHHLLGAKECTWGPRYWCQNLTAAADCHATKHCIQTEWIHKKLPPDNSNVCQTCLDMVKQARDQLESNETQELIKEVFEGSCKLLYIKPIVQECDKIADNYIPDLIDTLASEMNPQVVCSVAGLCNNEKFQLLIKEHENNNNQQQNKVKTCEGCHTVIDLMERKFNQMSRDDILESFLEVCGQFGSFSDACSNVIITYFNDIYNHLKNNFNSNNVCLMAGECTAQFHQHANVEITPISHIGYVKKDDLPCDLCKQLVGHLRDLLVANTTEDEFKRVLEGLCNQTKTFSTECNSLVEEYYGPIYNFLTSELNSTAVCEMTGLCPSNKKLTPIVPLLPVETAPKILEITEKPLNKIGLNRDDLNVEVIKPEMAQLPIDLLLPPHTQVLYNKELCAFCEYFLHYIQETISSPRSEEEIKEVIDKACSKLPRTINQTCISFVDMYESVIIAILAQEIDPSQVCPLIKACPSSNVEDVEIFMEHKGSDNKCPMCLLAVTELESVVKNEKTEENIKKALHNLCSHLSVNLAQECNDFVETYTKELIELLMADLNPQEVCVYLKLCKDNTPPRREFLPDEFPILGGDVETNMIMDNTIDGKVVGYERNMEEIHSNGECVLCEFVMKEIQSQIKDKKNEDEIIKIVHNICNVMPSTVRDDCNNFINEYGDAAIQVIISMTDPSDFCTMIHLCKNDREIQALKVEIFDCAICESIVWTMEKILDNPTIDHNVEHVLEKACRALPQKDQTKCLEIIDKYGRTIYSLIIHLANKGMVCKEIGMCASEAIRPAHAKGGLGNNVCTRGPGYWCLNEANAVECNALQHCQEKVWKAPKPFF